MLDTAMILAAGRGERLKPITDLIPKAMCVIDGKPLIEHHVINLKKAGIQKIIINHAYLGYQIKHHLGDGQQFGLSIIYQPEPPGGLETAGGIINALPYIGHKPFLVVNADVYTNFPFQRLIHTDYNKPAHIILIKKPNYLPAGDFGMLKNGLVINSPSEYTFACIARYEPQLFPSPTLTRRGLSSMLRMWVAQQNVSGEVFKGSWLDIGTPERLHSLKKPDYD